MRWPRQRLSDSGERHAQVALATNGISRYQIVTNDHSLAGITSTLRTVEVDCPAGKKVLGGDALYLDSTGSPFITVSAESIESYPTADGSRWLIVFCFHTCLIRGGNMGRIEEGKH